MTDDSNIKRTDWRIIAISVAVGSVITITYDFLTPCFEGFFQPNIHQFTCDPNSYAKIVAGFIAFLVGFAYLMLFKFSYRKKKNSTSNPTT